MARRERNKKNGRPVFTRRPHSGFLYRWSPETDINKHKNAKEQAELSCTATPSSQGSDDFVTYTYEVINTNGVLSRLAYVACDYVE